MAWHLVATEVPAGAEHIAVVGEPVRESDALRYGIRFRSVEIGSALVDDDVVDPFVPASRVVDDGEGHLVTEPAAHAGYVRTNTDAALARMRYLETPPVVDVDAQGAITASAEVDGYVLRVSLAPPPGTGGPDHQPAAVRAKLDQLVGRAWREHTR
jgi:hypothetical protein